MPNDKEDTDYMSDRQLINMALNYWANYIETGNITMSATDVVARLNARETAKQTHKFIEELEREPNIKVKALSLEQHKIVVRLRELASKIS